jgi:hypothetical protein
MRPVSSAPSPFTTIAVERASPTRVVTTYYTPTVCTHDGGNGQQTVFSAMTALPSMPPRSQRTGEVLCGSATAALKNVWCQTVAYGEKAISQPASFPPPALAQQTPTQKENSLFSLFRTQQVVLLRGLHVR